MCSRTAFENVISLYGTNDTNQFATVSYYIFIPIWYNVDVLKLDTYLTNTQYTIILPLNSLLYLNWHLEIDLWKLSNICTYEREKKMGLKFGAILLFTFLFDRYDLS